MTPHLFFASAIIAVIFTGSVILAPDGSLSGHKTELCCETATGPLLSIGAPKNGEEVNGNFQAFGWATAAGGVKNINFRLLDGNKEFFKMLEGITYGKGRQDVCNEHAALNDPNCPNVGWAGTIGAGSLRKGTYYLRVRAEDNSGAVSVMDRKFTVGQDGEEPDPPSAENCNPDNPGELLWDLERAVSGHPTQCSWEKKLSLDFRSWARGSSNNLPVIAAAIALYEYPAGQKRQQIISWWMKYLNAELGIELAEGMPPVLQYYGASEVNASVYQHYNLSSVLAVRLWADQNGNKQLLGLTRQYVRVAWAMFALSASNGGVSSIHNDGEQIPPSPKRFRGPALALSGARSNDRWAQYWGREFLFYRAVKWPTGNSNPEPDEQTALLNSLESQFPPARSLYGMPAGQQAELRRLVNTGQVPLFLENMLGSIRTIRPFHIVGWDGVRASLMEGNPNRNTQPTYGMVYFTKPKAASGQELHVLYPWNKPRKGITEGRAKLDFTAGFMEASNEPGSKQHPLKTVRIDGLPTTAPLFHLLLSPNRPPSLEGTQAKATLVVIAKPTAGLRAKGQSIGSAKNAQVGPLEDFLKKENLRLEPLYGESEEKMLAKRSQIIQKAGQAVPDLSLFYQMEVPQGEAERLIEELLGMDIIDGAYEMQEGGPSVVAGTWEMERRSLSTPDYTSHQGYFGPSPQGIDVDYAWKFPGSKGDGVKVVDVEQNWILDHEDLAGQNVEVVSGTPTGSSLFFNHGANSLGIIGALENDFGVNGIVPNSGLGVSSVKEKQNSPSNLSRAIKDAADYLSPGDIIVIPWYRPHPVTGAPLPPEWFPDVLAVIQYAASQGIIVVEAAANGSEDLDAAYLNAPIDGFPSYWRNPLNHHNPSSNAIIVGAGDPPPNTHECLMRNPPCNYVGRARSAFSNYGARVDVQAWGNEATTIGGFGNKPGELQGGTDKKKWYTDQHGGTSSASVLVAGALASVQGILKAGGKPLLSPTQAINILRQTGSPQTSAPGRPAAQRVGNLLDLRAIISRLGLEPPSGQGGNCQPAPSAACLQNERFQVEIDWVNHQNGTRGIGQAVPFSDQTGFFWFFNKDNIEVIVKILDGRQINSHYWVYYGGLTDLEYTLKVKDTKTGAEKSYTKEKGSYCGKADTGAFPAAAGGPAATPAASNPASEELSLLNGRFKLRVDWKNQHDGGKTGCGKAVPLTEKSGAFWFFNRQNVELVVKVLDGQGINGHFWTYAASLTDVEFTLTVTDTQTGKAKTYHNEPGKFCGWGDTRAIRP